MAQPTEILKGTLGLLLTDESAYRELDALIASTRRVTTALEAGRGTIGRWGVHFFHVGIPSHAILRLAHLTRISSIML